MRISVVTLFPEFFESPLSVSIPARAIAAGAATVDFVDPREFATDAHRTVDDTPYGGGAGMVMRSRELGDAIASLSDGAILDRKVILLTPQGRPFNQKRAQTLAAGGGFVLVCGRYEGVDERFIEQCVDEELSMGDFVLSGGEPAAIAVIDSVLRLLPDVLGNEASLQIESFSDSRLEGPHFTRPRDFEGLEVPEVLMSGHHQRIADWRRKVSLLRTRERRPDLFERLSLDPDDRRVLEDSSIEVDDWLIKPRFPDSGS